MSAALCMDSAPQPRRAASTRATYVGDPGAAFITFGLGSWISINSVGPAQWRSDHFPTPIFVQSSFLVYHLPEHWALTTWSVGDRIVVALQLANFCVMLVLRPLVKRPAPAWALLSSMLLLLGFGACVALAAGVYRSTAWLFGAERSAGLLAMTFVAGVASCGSSLVFYPLAAHFPRRYTTALAIGEGLSGSIAGVLGMLQNAGGAPQSFAMAFGLAAVLCVVSALGLMFIHRQRSTKLEDDAPSSPLAADQGSQGSVSAGQGVSPGYAGFVALFLGAALNFGLLPSLNPIACSHYRDSQTVLLWSNAVIYGFDPISRLMTAWTSFRHLNVLTSLFSLAALVVVLLAKWPKALATFDQRWVVPMANVVFATCFGYARTMAFLVLKDAPNAARLYWIAGMVLQAGSFCGSVASWPKVAGLQPPEFQPLAMAPL
ncbi:unnamed protein product [Cladocopium goreaui]|uniref:Nodulin-like domain-containing protein n=1 Tax=Cladocopium goreaui TaxID=2562237 RepID=A0A9P1CPZ7_9DINO|nr:unnamed protein product [Cladocopium goreaui]